jgi:hypothetical protein
VKARVEEIRLVESGTFRYLPLRFFFERPQWMRGDIDRRVQGPGTVLRQPGRRLRAHPAAGPPRRGFRRICGIGVQRDPRALLLVLDGCSPAGRIRGRMMLAPVSMFLFLLRSPAPEAGQ